MGALGVNAVDMIPRHAGAGLDNADALPTCPQRQQPQTLFVGVIEEDGDGRASN